MLKVRPSASGFMIGRSIRTKYSSGCLRYLLVASKAKAPQIDQTYQDVGLFHEELFAAEHADELKEREFVIKAQITPEVEFSGRCDFLLKDGSIIETKASFSDSILYDVIRKGKVQTNHLSQIVSYMVQLKLHTGRIVVGYYTQFEGQFVREEQRELVVTVDDNGGIAVDGIYTGYNVRDQVAHTLMAASILVSEEVANRPYNAFTVDGPCRFCPLRDICDKFDAQEIDKQEFITNGVLAIESQKPKAPKIKQRKKKK